MPGGVVCDKREQICYDQRGANAAQTRRMFGEYAGKDVQKRLDKKDDWGTKKFTLSNGVKCSIPNRTCKKDEGEGERSKKITKHLFEAPVPQPR
jgi:uracil-DNA glycosylase